MLTFWLEIRSWNVRWYQPALTWTPRISWWLTDAVISVLNSRLMSGSQSVGLRTPNWVVELGPISLSSAMPLLSVGFATLDLVEVPGMRSTSNQLRLSVTRAAVAWF